MCKMLGESEGSAHNACPHCGQAIPDAVTVEALQAKHDALAAQLARLEEFVGHITEVVNSLTADADTAERVPVIDWQRGSRLEQ